MKKWTEAEITQLKQLVDERKTVNEIAIIMGKTPTSINSTKVRYGIRKPMLLSHNNPLHLAEVIKFKMAGWTLQEIGKVYGCTDGHVCNMFRKNGMAGFMRISRKPGKPYNYWSGYELHSLRTYLRGGYSRERIHRHFPNRSANALCIRINHIKRWDKHELHSLRKYLRYKYSLNHICTYFPNRSREDVEIRIKKITRYWLSDQEQDERKRLRANHMKWRVW